VSIEAVPGAIENVALLGFALTPPPAQPASTSSAGPSSMAGIRVSRPLKGADRPRIVDFKPAISFWFRTRFTLTLKARE
jgi:hypothetical protein